MRRPRDLKLDFTAVRGKRLLIALSGGADSVALACLLAEAREAFDLRLEAAHLDHAIRPDSAEDARFCEALCRKLDIPFYSLRVDIPAESKRTGEGLETVARRVRYGWLREVKRAVGADHIALAHHMDDQAETVLMHLARGAGPEGIVGMREISGDLYRPLLGIRKQTLVAFLSNREQPWREDVTNTQADTARNQLRLHGIPALEQSYPQAVPAIARYADAAAIESDYVQIQTEVYISEHSIPLPDGVYLELSPRPHEALLRRAMRAFAPGCGWERLTTAAALADESRGSQEIGGGMVAERGAYGLYLIKNRPVSDYETVLGIPGSTDLDGLCRIEAVPAPPKPVRDDPMVQVLDARALEGAVVRTRRNGDRIRPLGCGERLLSDYLTDRKIDRPLRDRLALVARGNHVLWVCGVGIAEDAKIRPDTARALRLKCGYSFDMRRLLK